MGKTAGNGSCGARRETGWTRARWAEIFPWMETLIPPKGPPHRYGQTEKRIPITISITLDPDMIVRWPGVGLWEETRVSLKPSFRVHRDKPQTRNGITYGWKLDWTKRNVLVSRFRSSQGSGGTGQPAVSRGHAKTLNWRVSSVKGTPLPALVAYRDPSEFLAATRDSQPRR